MRPQNLKTKIFLDGGSPKETKDAIELLGLLDGQTTNPTLIAKEVEGKKFSKDELKDLYKSVVSEMSTLIPNGSISIQVYSDQNTKASEMLEQGKEMYSWIPNARIKFPTTLEGIKAAEQAVKLGMRVNMTLLFSQSQAAAVYSATLGAKRGQVIISPFIGRSDDLGINGMSLIENILKMFENSDHHVEVLGASIRSMDHLLYSFKLGTDIVTIPFKTIKEWVDSGKPMPDENYNFPKNGLKDLPYEQLDLEKDWQEFNLQHDLTDRGLEKFSSDWNNLLK